MTLYSLKTIRTPPLHLIVTITVAQMHEGRPHETYRNAKHVTQHSALVYTHFTMITVSRLMPLCSVLRNWVTKQGNRLHSKKHQAVPDQAVTLSAGAGLKSLRDSGKHSNTTVWHLQQQQVVSEQFLGSYTLALYRDSHKTWNGDCCVLPETLIKLLRRIGALFLLVLLKVKGRIQGVSASKSKNTQ